jgi:hypothetical protein
VIEAAATETPAALDVVWTVPAIARVIGRSERACYHALETNQVPGARKIAGRWCLAPQIFYASFANSDPVAA